MKRNRKWKMLHTVLESQTLHFGSYESWKLKVKTVMSYNSRKKEGIF